MTQAIYGTVADVVALTRMWTRNGVFVDPDPDAVPEVIGTNPTLAQVNTWLEKVSAQMDLSLAQNWFTLPIDITLPAYDKVVAVLSNVVIPLVADLVNHANSTGRFYTETALERGVSPMKVIAKDINAWVSDYADGLVALGMTRNTPAPSGVSAGYVVRISRS